MEVDIPQLETDKEADPLQQAIVNSGACILFCERFSVWELVWERSQIWESSQIWERVSERFWERF